ncbi:MAG TPA: glycosyltransferase family 9 protein [Gemmatimonadales bacterium]|nr:glycosyltransferase family 9 protein [Gemmatimonadales bacterium]
MSHSIVLSPQILAVRFGSTGDILFATPLFRAIRARHPGVHLTVVTRRRYVPLLADNPRVDEVIGLAPGASLLRLASRIRAGRFDHLLDLDGSPRARMLHLLAPGRWRTAPQYRFAREMLIRTKMNYYPEDMPLPERYFDAARDLDVAPDGGPLELFLSEEAEEQAAGWLAQAGVGQGRPLVGFAPGGSRPTKRWPLEHWVRLVRRVAGTGADAVLVGGPEDTAIAAEVAVRSTTRAVNAAGALGLQATAAVLKRCAALISGHTAAFHLATAVGTPVVGLFGPTVRAFGTYPYHARRATVLERSLSCRPCSRDGGAECPMGHHLCMLEIQPDAVFSALCRTLA